MAAIPALVGVEATGVAEAEGALGVRSLGPPERVAERVGAQDPDEADGRGHRH